MRGFLGIRSIRPETRGFNFSSRCNQVHTMTCTSLTPCNSSEYRVPDVDRVVRHFSQSGPLTSPCQLKPVITGRSFPQPKKLGRWRPILEELNPFPWTPSPYWRPHPPSPWSCIMAMHPNLLRFWYKKRCANTGALPVLDYALDVHKDNESNQGMILIHEL